MTDSAKASTTALTIGSTVLGVDDMARARTFWMTALDYVPRANPTTPGSSWCRATAGGTAGPRTERDARPGPPSHHLDLYAADPAREVERLVGLGASAVDDWDGYREDSDFIVLEDTERNRFCVIDKSG